MNMDYWEFKSRGTAVLLCSVDEPSVCFFLFLNRGNGEMPRIFSLNIITITLLLLLPFFFILLHFISGTVANISTYMFMWQTLLFTSQYLTHNIAYIATKT